MIRAFLFGVLMWGTCLYAFYRGGRAEKVVAAGILAATYLTVFVASPFASRFQHIEMPTMLVDLSMFLLLLVTALRSEKFWPLWLTAMQGLTICSHLAPYVPHVIPWAYGNALAMWIYPMLVILAIATRMHHRRTTMAGASSTG